MSRRQRAVIFALGIFLIAALVCLDRRLHKHRLGYSDKPAEQKTPVDIKKYHCKTFTVVKVVDGDTIDIDIADGKYPHSRIRLWGVDTPETKSEDFGVMYFGPEAAEFTSKSVLGKKVCLYLDKTKTRGKYGRLLAYVQLPDSRFLNEILIEEGFGYADLRFPHKFYNRYLQLQASAKRQKKGLWKEAKRHQLPQWLQREKPGLLYEK